ncbi:MAG: hypothetical protein L0H12_02355, partial [Nitrosospira sp.]|nr:hypothetical protein [Nitrosospira sp.]
RDCHQRTQAHQMRRAGLHHYPQSDTLGFVEAKDIDKFPAFYLKTACPHRGTLCVNKRCIVFEV